jgi:S-adenosyl-L-methionine hydrolase (adenosine-forming)
LALDSPAKVYQVKSLIITLLTDFGTGDYYVAAMKGVILSRSPGTHLVDISHEIEPQVVLSGAYVLLGAYNWFPPGTIHVGVVDPGVGSSRRAIILRTQDYFFVGPDNGLFSFAVPDPVEAFEIRPSVYLPQTISKTFHGRDIFAPVAAALSSGVNPAELGSPVRELKGLPALAEITGKEIHSRIIHIDRFGNAVTGIRLDLLNSEILPGSFQLRVGDHLIQLQKRFYADSPIEARRSFVIWGSLNFLEISITNGSAAKALGLFCGQEVTLTTP